MNGYAEAISHGAATIVNALAIGRGVAFGVDLYTKATVELTNTPSVISGEIIGDQEENTLLIKKTVMRVLKYFGLEKKIGAKVQTESNIPIARGLKSSSVAANAVSLATIGALCEDLDDLSVVNLGVDACFDAKVTVTGAFDDACASYFGGVVVTDNFQRKIVKQCILPDNLHVVFFVPEKKVYTINSNVVKIKKVKSLVEIAYNEALKNNFWTALSLNGLIYSSVMGYDSSIAADALCSGAVAAGLCGKGPAVTVVVPPDRFNEVKTTLEKYEGELIQSHLNTTKAKVVQLK